MTSSTSATTRATRSTTSTSTPSPVNADAIAFTVLTFAYSTESVNGVPGRRVPGNFQIPAPAGPQGTFATPGGGLGHDHGPQES